MRGSVKNYLSLFATLLFAYEALAHVPLPGQLSRYQANMLRTEKAFSVQGTATSSKARIAYLLQWYSPGNYTVTLSGIPKAFFRGDSGSTQWTLLRQGKTCVLKSEEFTVSCPPPNFWAMLELSGRPDLTPKSLVEFGFFADADTVYAESNSKTPVDLSKRRVHPAVGYNGNTPMAVLEIRGPRLSGEISGEEHPIIQFDQTFLSPLMARFKHDGQLVTIRATSDLEVRRNRSRFSHVLASRLDVLNGKMTVASFSRQEPTPISSVQAPLPKTITDIGAFAGNLSPEGKAFLDALFLTH